MTEMVRKPLPWSNAVVLFMDMLLTQNHTEVKCWLASVNTDAKSEHDLSSFDLVKLDLFFVFP